MERNSLPTAALKTLLDALAEALAQDDLNLARDLATEIRKIWQREQPSDTALRELESILGPLEDLQRFAAADETVDSSSISEDPRNLTQWHLHALQRHWTTFSPPPALAKK